MQSRGVNTRGSGGGGHLRAGARAQIDRASSAGSSGSRVHPMIQICLYLLLPVRPGTARHVRRAALIIRMSHTYRNWESPKLTRPHLIMPRAAPLSVPFLCVSPGPGGLQRPLLLIWCLCVAGWL